MASQAQISLRFSRSATAASSVKVSVCDAAGKPIDGATASLTSSHAFKATGNAVTAAMLCPNVNGNTSPTITLTFKIDGLPDALPTPHYALLDIHALNASGSYQSNNDGKARQFNVEINGGAKVASSEIKGQLTNVDIAAGIGDETGVHQEWSLPLSATCQLGNSLYLRLTVTAGKSNMGCFFGLTSVSLVEKMPEPEFRPFEASDETGSPKMIYSLLTPKGQALAMNAEGTLALEPRTDAPSQTWYFVGKNALAGGYLLVNAQGNRSYVVSGNEAARWVAKQAAEQPAFFSLRQMVGDVAGEALNVSGDTLFVVRPARNVYSHHAQIYDMPCGTLSGTYLTHLELRDTQDAQPLIYPANALANGAVVGKKAGKPANWYTIYTKAAAHTSPGSTLTLSGLLNQRLDDGESLTAYFDWNRDGIFETSVALNATDRFEESIPVPEDALLGESRMRLRLTANGLLDAEDEVAGQTADFIVKVVEAQNAASVVALSCDTLRGTVSMQPEESGYRLTATALGNAKFLGWYCGDNAVSGEADFLLSPAVGGVYTALFSPNTQETPTGIHVVPAMQEIAVSFSVKGSVVTAEGPVKRLSLYTVNGRRLAEKRGASINCKRLPKGNYLVVAHTGNGDFMQKIFLDL